MIARVWHGVTAAERAEEYSDYLNETGWKDCRATEGNRGVLVLRRIHEGRAEFTFLSLWESFDAIRKFAGGDSEKAVYYPRDKEFLFELAPTVTHYEALADFAAQGGDSGGR